MTAAIKTPLPRQQELRFMAALMETIRLQGLRCMHIIEADTRGPTDLLVWQGSEILGWIECKVDDRKVEPAQIEFLRDRDAESGAAFVFRLSTDEALIRVYRSESKLWRDLKVVDVIPDPDKVNWKLWFWKNRSDAMRYK